jgi:O-antigen ligase
VDTRVREKCGVAHPSADVATAPPPPAPERWASAAGGVALLALGAVLVEAAADVLPDGPVVGVLTPLRVAVLVGMAALVVAAAPWNRPPRLRPLSVFDPALALLLLAAAVATVVAGQPWAPWRAVLTTVAVFVLALGVRRLVADSGPALGLLALVAVAVAATAGLRQAADGTPTGFCRGAPDGSADACTGAELVRVTGTFANPNLLAALLVLLLPAAAAGAASRPDRASRLLGGGVVALGCAALLLTGSRGGILAGVVGAAVLVVLRRPTRPRVLGAAATGVAALALLGLLTGGRLGARTDVWAAALRIAVANPLGVGPGRAGPLIAAAVPGDEPFAHAHDLWLHHAVETGAAGLLAVLVITALAGAVAVRDAARGSLTAAAAGAGLAGFAVLSVADHPAATTRIAVALFAVLGVLAAGADRPAEGR